MIRTALRPWKLAVVVLAAASASGCGGGSTGGPTTSTSAASPATSSSNHAHQKYTPIPLRGQIVQVTEGIPDDNSITMSKYSVRKGLVSFQVTNYSGVAHDFEIAGKATIVLAQEETAILTVDFIKAGNYTYRSRMGDAPGTLKVTN